MASHIAALEALPGDVVDRFAVAAARRLLPSRNVANLGFERKPGARTSDFGYIKHRRVGLHYVPVCYEFDLSRGATRPHRFVWAQTLRSLDANSASVRALDAPPDTDLPLTRLGFERVRRVVPAATRGGFVGLVNRCGRSEFRLQFVAGARDISRIASDVGVSEPGRFKETLDALDWSRLHVQLTLADDEFLPRVWVEVGLARWSARPPSQWLAFFRRTCSTETTRWLTSALDAWWRAAPDSCRWAHFKFDPILPALPKVYFWLQGMDQS